MTGAAIGEGIILDMSKYFNKIIEVNGSSATVQPGVFYRDFVRKEAEKRGVAGFVRNLQNGNVEIVAEAPESKLEPFIRECKRGSFLSHVAKVDVKYENTKEEFEDFEIRF